MIVRDDDAFDQVQKLLPRLGPAERSRVLQQLIYQFGDTFTGVVKTEGVCGGDACIVRTRVPVWTLEEARRGGASDTQLLEAFPSLRPADLVQAWAYVEMHRPEIDQQIKQNEAA
jgi:uncharacterized protein (DUF433 family)